MKNFIKSSFLFLMIAILLTGALPRPGEAEISLESINNESRCGEFFDLILPGSDPLQVGSVFRLNGHPLTITHFSTSLSPEEHEASYRKEWTSTPLWSSWIIPGEVLKIATSIPDDPSPFLCQVILLSNPQANGSSGFWVEEEILFPSEPSRPSHLPSFPHLEEILTFEEVTSLGTSLTMLSEGKNGVGETRSEIQEQFVSEGWIESRAKNEEGKDDSLIQFHKGDKQCLVILSPLGKENRTLAMIALEEKKGRH